MFTPTGLLKMVVCPGGSECTAINCIFSHDFDEKTSHEDDIKSIEMLGVTQPANQSPAPEPQAKRRKLSNGLADNTSPRSAASVASFPGEDSATDTAPEKTTIQTRETHHNQDKDLVDKSSAERKSASTKGTSAIVIGRSSAPTPEKPSISKASGTGTPKSSPGDRRTTAGVTPAAAQPRSTAGRTVNPPISELRPRPLRDKSISVAQQLQRKTYLKHIFAEMKRLNAMMVKSGSKDKVEVIMDEAALMQASIEVEYEVAQEQPSTVYSNYIRRRIADLKKMKMADWTVYVQKTIMTKDNDTDTLQSKVSAATEIKTGLSVEQELKSTLR